MQRTIPSLSDHVKRASVLLSLEASHAESISKQSLWCIYWSLSLAQEKNLRESFGKELWYSVMRYIYKNKAFWQTFPLRCLLTGIIPAENIHIVQTNKLRRVPFHYAIIKMLILQSAVHPTRCFGPTQLGKHHQH